METPSTLARLIRDFLHDEGSIDAVVLEPAEVSLKYGLSGKNPAVECKDKSLYYLCKFDEKFERLTLSDEGSWALPYNDHLMICFNAD